MNVPVSFADKQKSYYKYYLEPMESLTAEKQAIVDAGPGDPKDALTIDRRNELFRPGYMPGEIGYWCLEDGTAAMANFLFMPGVTEEMFHWWSAWHPQDRLRYAIWNPEEHYDVTVTEEGQLKDLSLCPLERTWNTGHKIWESIGLGGTDLMYISFKSPGEMGYDPSQIGEDACGTVAVCANGITVGGADSPDMPAVLTHFIRPVEGGIELRSRFWMGYHIIDGKPVKLLPDGARIPAIAPKCLLRHSIAEMTRLAGLLPRIYWEEKDNW